MNQNRTACGLFALTLGAVGVVYGDIGTSPLYALKEVFTNAHVPLTERNIYGVLSLVFWTLTVIVSVKYVVLQCGSGLAAALQDVAYREAALVTFLVTLSGLSLGGVGSAFWGVVAGALTLFVQQWRPRVANRRGPSP